MTLVFSPLPLHHLPCTSCKLCWEYAISCVKYYCNNAIISWWKHASCVCFFVFYTNVTADFFFHASMHQTIWLKVYNCFDALGDEKRANIFKHILLNEKFYILIEISMKLVPVDCGLSIWGKIMIPMYRLRYNGLYGPRCPLSPERPLNLITQSPPCS